MCEFFAQTTGPPNREKKKDLKSYEIQKDNLPTVEVISQWYTQKGNYSGKA